MKRIKLSEFIDSCGDGIHGTPVYCNAGDYYFINGNNLNGRTISINNQTPRIDKRQFSLIKRPLSERTILLSINGTLGKTAFYNNEKIALGKSICYINIKPEYDKFFFRYILVTKEFKKYMSRVSHGSTIKNFAPSQVGEFEIELPDFKYHSRIADMLNGIDSKISTNSKIIETSEKLMREIYDYWFVQFDFPDENGRPYKSSGGEMVYDETIKREIPKGWKACNILDVADWVGGAQPPKSTFIYEPRNGYVRFIQNRDYADDNYKTWIPESKSNKICDRLDIMMDKYGDAGRIRFGLAGAYNVALAKIAIEKENLREYMRGFLSSDAIYQYLYNACMASTRASLNEEILGNLNLVIPSEEILSKYQSIAEQNIQLILNLSDENKQLASLRDWLLPMLMNGQIKVSD